MDEITSLIPMESDSGDNNKKTMMSGILAQPKMVIIQVIVRLHYLKGQSVAATYSCFGPWQVCHHSLTNMMAWGSKLIQHGTFLS